MDKSLREMPEEPGVYPGILSAWYHNWHPAASSSQLRKISTHSPAHLKAALENPSSTAAQEFGDALHAAVFQPEIFDTYYVERPPGHANSNAYKKAAAKVLADNPGARLLKTDTRDRVLRCRDALHAHPTAGVMLRDPGPGDELSLVWDDQETGARCKARLDAPRDEWGIIDLKKTRDARAWSFGRDAWTYRYDLQGAFYERGAFELGMELPTDYFLIAVEEHEPFGIKVYKIPGLLLANAEEEAEELLRIWARCQQTGEWPGYPPEVDELRFPSYAETGAEDRILNLEEVAA